MITKLLFGSLVGLLWMQSCVSTAVAQLDQIDEPRSVGSSQDTHNRPGNGPHGGALHQIGSLQIEAVVQRSGIRAFVYDLHMRPVNISGARGLATLKVSGDPKRYRYDLFVDASRGERGSSLSAAVDLSRLAGRSVEIELQVVALPQANKRSFVLRGVASVPMTKEQLVAAAIAKQKNCPVSGQPLGSMGTPIAVQVGDQTVYVCCQSCVDALTKDSSAFVKDDRALAKKTAVDEATLKDAQYVTAQKRCPVMDEPLDAMGGPWRTVVGDKIVYICCPGCAKKLHAEPDRYLAKLASQGVRPPVLGQ